MGLTVTGMDSYRCLVLFKGCYRYSTVCLRDATDIALSKGCYRYSTVSKGCYRYSTVCLRDVTDIALCV